MASSSTIADASVNDWWQTYEVLHLLSSLTLLVFLPLVSVCCISGTENLLTNAIHKTNVERMPLVTKAFLPTANPTKTANSGVTSGPFTFLAVAMIGFSACLSSKLAQVKVLEFLAAENENVFVASVYPGMIETEIFGKGRVESSRPVPMDTLLSCSIISFSNLSMKIREMVLMFSDSTSRAVHGLGS